MGFLCLNVRSLHSACLEEHGSEHCTFYTVHVIRCQSLLVHIGALESVHTCVATAARAVFSPPDTTHMPPRCIPDASRCVPDAPHIAHRCFQDISQMPHARFIHLHDLSSATSHPQFLIYISSCSIPPWFLLLDSSLCFLPHGSPSTTAHQDACPRKPPLQGSSG